MEQDLEPIRNKIYEIRGQRVMLDRDLAELYGVETRVLNQSVKRNANRFPEDFMFQLTKEECLRSQIVTLKEKRGHHIKYMPYVFTELVTCRPERHQRVDPCTAGCHQRGTGRASGQGTPAATSAKNRVHTR